MAAPKPGLMVMIDRQREALDRLARDVSLGYTQRQFDDLETRARGIAAGLIAAFRGGPAACCSTDKP